MTVTTMENSSKTDTKNSGDNYNNLVRHNSSRAGDVRGLVERVAKGIHYGNDATGNDKGNWHKAEQYLASFFGNKNISSINDVNAYAQTAAHFKGNWFAGLEDVAGQVLSYNRTFPSLGAAAKDDPCFDKAVEGNGTLLFFSDERLKEMFPNTDPIQVRTYVAKHRKPGVKDEDLLGDYVRNLKDELANNIHSAVYDPGYDRDHRIKVLRHSINRMPERDDSFDLMRKEAQEAIEKIEVATGLFKPVEGRTAEAPAEVVAIVPSVPESAPAYDAKPEEKGDDKGESELCTFVNGESASEGKGERKHSPESLLSHPAAVAAASGARTYDGAPKTEQDYGAKIEEYDKKLGEFLGEMKKREDESIANYEKRAGAAIKRAEIELGTLSKGAENDISGVRRQFNDEVTKMRHARGQQEAQLNGLAAIASGYATQLEDLKKTRQSYDAELARTTEESNKRFAAMDGAANQLQAAGKEMGGLSAQLKSEVDAAAESRKKLDELAVNYANAPEEARKLAEAAAAKEMNSAKAGIDAAGAKALGDINQYARQVNEAGAKAVDDARAQVAEAGRKSINDLEARATELTGGDPNAESYTATNEKTIQEVEAGLKRQRGYVSPWKRAGQLIAGAALLGALYLGITMPKAKPVVNQPAAVIVQNNTNLEARLTRIENAKPSEPSITGFVKKSDYDNDLKGLRAADDKNAADIRETGDNLVKMANDLYKFVPDQIKKFGESLKNQPKPPVVEPQTQPPVVEPVKPVKPITPGPVIGPEPNPNPEPAPAPQVEEKKMKGDLSLRVEALSGDSSGQQARANALFRVGDDYNFRLDAFEKSEKHDLSTGEEVRGTTLWAMPELSIKKGSNSFDFKANLYESREKMDGEDNTTRSSIEAGLPVTVTDRSAWEQDSTRTLSALSGDVRLNNLRLFGNAGSDRRGTTYKSDSDIVATVGSMPPIVVNNDVKTTTNATTNFFTLGAGYNLGNAELGVLGRHKETDWSIGAKLNGASILDDDGSSKQDTFGAYGNLELDNFRGGAKILSSSGDDLESSQKIEGAVRANVLLNDNFVLGVGGERSDGGAKARGTFFWKTNDSKTGKESLENVDSYADSAENERLFPETTTAEQKRAMRVDRDMSAGASGLLLSAEGGKEGVDKGDYWRVDAAAPIPFTKDKAFVYGVFQDGDSFRLVEGGVGYKPKKNFRLGWGFWSEENKETDTKTNATGPSIGVEW